MWATRRIFGLTVSPAAPFSRYAGRRSLAGSSRSPTDVLNNLLRQIAVCPVMPLSHFGIAAIQLGIRVHAWVRSNLESRFHGHDHVSVAARWARRTARISPRHRPRSGHYL